MFKDLLINLLILLASTKEFESVISYVMYSVEIRLEDVWFKVKDSKISDLQSNQFPFEFLNADLVLPFLPDYAYT